MYICISIVSIHVGCTTWGSKPMNKWTQPNLKHLNPQAHQIDPPTHVGVLPSRNMDGVPLMFCWVNLAKSMGNLAKHGITCQIYR